MPMLTDKSIRYTIWQIQNGRGIKVVAEDITEARSAAVGRVCQDMDGTRARPYGTAKEPPTLVCR